MPPDEQRSPCACTERRPSFSRSFLALGLAALMARCRPAACGGGELGLGLSVKDGFTQASQSAGTLTVWVDSTRVPAAQAYQKAHPNVKLNIVTYDGDANGANTLQTKVDLYRPDRQRLAGCRVQRRAQRDELGGDRRIHRAAERGPDPAGRR